MKKVSIALLIIVILIIGISFVLKKMDAVKAAPDVSKAEYVVKTGQTYFYTNYYEEGKSRIHGEYLILHGYWDSKDGKSWDFHPGDLQLNYQAYPNLEIGVR